MRYLAPALLLALVAVLAVAACRPTDSALTARVSELESDMGELESILNVGDFESRLGRVEDSLYGSDRPGTGVRGVLDRLYEVESDVRSLERQSTGP
jgi:hypothetical protein